MSDETQRIILDKAGVIIHGEDGRWYANGRPYATSEEAVAGINEAREERLKRELPQAKATGVRRLINILSRTVGVLVLVVMVLSWIKVEGPQPHQSRAEQLRRATRAVHECERWTGEDGPIYDDNGDALSQDALYTEYSHCIDLFTHVKVPDISLLQRWTRITALG